MLARNAIVNVLFHSFGCEFHRMGPSAVAGLGAALYFNFQTQENSTTINQANHTALAGCHRHSTVLANKDSYVPPFKMARTVNAVSLNMERIDKACPPKTVFWRTEERELARVTPSLQRIWGLPVVQRVPVRPAANVRLPLSVNSARLKRSQVLSCYGSKYLQGWT